MLIWISRLKLLNDVFIALNCSLHLLLEIIELSLEFCSFSLLETHLIDLLIKIMLHEFHFEKYITCLVYPILAWVQIDLVTLILKIYIPWFVNVASSMKVGILRIGCNDLTLVLVLNCIYYLWVDEIALSWEASDCQVDEISGLPR